jgi:UDP-N-acetylglucosamine 3-dehydrogenase
MDKLRVGFIGTGKRQRASRTGYAMAYQHAAAYNELDNCEMVACADIVQENADEFAKVNNVPTTYLDYHDGERESGHRQRLYLAASAQPDGH